MLALRATLGGAALSARATSRVWSINGGSVRCAASAKATGKIMQISCGPGLRVHGAGNLFRYREIFGKISVAKLDSYRPDLFGTFVPVN
jgi:hypothetical protein